MVKKGFKKYKVSKTKTKKYKKNSKAPKAMLGDVFQTALSVGQKAHGIGSLVKANRALKQFD